ncbi:MAG: InlB B-repeat-containing protein [Kiritimatiellae bacterium]|nr:InlB B-repeat-containing protein [Kiritimatiellia bacterium]
MNFVKKTVLGFLVALLCGAAWCGVAANGHAGARRVNHLTRVSSHGRIAVKAEGNRFSESAKVSFSRTRADGVKRRIMEGLAKKRRGGPRLLGAAKEPSSRKEPSVLAMYDISIESDGAKWQPAAGEPVQVDVTLDEPVAITPGATLGVAHLADDGTVEALPASRYSFTYNAAKTAVTAFSFSAEGFSVYAITEGDDHTADSDPARRIYQFYTLDESDSYVPFYFVADDNTRTFRQIVKDGQSLARPEMVSSKGRTFMGWYLFDGTDYAAAPFDFSKPITFDANETGEHVYTLRARFGDVGYVIFHDQSMTVGADKKWPITVVRRAPLTKNGDVLEATVEIDDVTVTYDESANNNAGEEEQENSAPKMIFRGWSRTPVDPGEPKDIHGDDVVRVESPLTFTRVEGDKVRPVDLYPIFVPIHWLSYQSAKTGEGASYCPPECLYEDEGKDELPQPNRTGYTFAGWYTEADGGVKVGNADGTLNTSADLTGWGGYFDGGKLKLRADVKLYGHWTPTLTRYSVVIWRQKATDDPYLPNAEKKYDFAESIERTDHYAEDVVDVESDPYKNYAGSGNYVGFHYSHCDGSAIVRGDGSTVLNVYYDRNVHTYRFFPTTTAGTLTPTYSYSYTPVPCSFTYTEHNCNVTYTTYASTYTYVSYSYVYTKTETSRVRRSNSSANADDNMLNNQKTIGGIAVTYSGTTYYIKYDNSWYRLNNDSGSGSDLYNNAKTITVGNNRYYTYTKDTDGTFTIGNEVIDQTYLNTLNGTNKKTVSGYSISYYSSWGWYSTTYYCIEIDGRWYQISSNDQDVYNNATAINRTPNTTTGSFTLGASSDATTASALEAGKKSVGDYEVSTYNNTYYIKINGAWRQIATNGETVYNNATSITVTPNANDSTQSFALGAIAGAADAATLESSAWKKTIGGNDVSYIGSGASRTYYVKYEGTWYQIPSSYGSIVYDDATVIAITSNAANASFNLVETAVASDVAALDSADWEKTVGDYEVSCIGIGTSRTYYVKSADTWYKIPAAYGSSVYDNATEITVGTPSSPVSGTFTVGTTAVDNSTDIDTLESNKRTAGTFDVSYNGSTYYIKLVKDGKWYQITGNNGSVVYNNATDITVAMTSTQQGYFDITALYGANISSYFSMYISDDAFASSGTLYSFDVSSPNSAPYTERLVALETMDDYDIVFKRNTYNYTGGTINYYVEVDREEYDETESEKRSTFNGKYYVLYKSIAHNFNHLTYEEDYHPLTGYSRDKSHASPNTFGANNQASIPNSGVNNLYYDRESKEIEFVDSYGNLTLDSMSMLYTQKLAPKVDELFPNGPTSRREGYTFTGWYADSSCTTRVFFEEDEEYNNYTKNKVLFDRVPAYNLQIFAGWETEWYLIQIDPNGGQLSETDSTWFWEPYGGENVYEYNTASRSFIPSASGEWFYVVKNRDYYKSALAGEYGDQGDFDKFVADTWSDFEDDNGKTILGDRRAYYTKDVNDPGITDFTRYENRVNAYRYSGWYEVLMDDNGNEIGEALYKFGQKVTHDTTLRLHWKSLGTYELHYVAGDGTIDRLDDNEEHTFQEALDVAVFNDHSDLVVTRTATAPEGKYFVGWTVRNGDGTVYFPGQSFVLDAIYSEADSASNVRVVYLDAVYETIRTVSLTLDVNGSSLANASIGDDATSLTLAHPDPADKFTSGTSDTTRTVSGLPNNAYGHLSDGTGYTCTIGDETLTFLGWNTRKDGTGTHFAPGAYVGIDALDTLDGSGANTLYAEWAVNVYFDKNNTQYTWEPGSADAWNANEFTYIAEGANAERYSQQTTLNGHVRNPGVLHDIVDEETGKPMMFDFWSTKRYQETADLEAYNFEETPVEGPLVLYAAWRDLIEVPLRVVDASAEEIVEHSELIDNGGWLTQLSIQVGNTTDVSFNDSPTQYVQLPSEGNYQYAFACVATSKDDISEGRKISRVYYNTSARSVYVEYADRTSEALPSEMKVFMVYFKNPRLINIGYREMGLDGFTTVTAKTTAPTETSVGAEALNVAESLLATPLQYPESGSYQHYAYALGDPDATAAAQLHYITETKTSDGSRPALQIRNTWRGFEYSSDGGTTWTRYGFDMQLYVVYFTAQPTIITLREETIGTAEDISAEFTYDVVISGGGSSESSTVTLRNGEAESLTLFASSSVQQTISITQRPKDGFTTTIGITEDDAGVNGTANDFVYTATAATSGGAETVTYTNSRGLLPLELNVAFGSGGEVTNVNGEYRTDAESGYTLNVPIQAGDPAPTPFSVTEQALTGRNKVYAEGTAADGLLSKEVGATHVFVGVWYGRPAQADGEAEEGDKVELKGRVTSVGFVKLAREDYYGICLNDDPELPLGSYKLYYVYSEMPRIHYVKEGANGTLVKLETLAYQGVAYENVMPQDSMMSVGEAEALSVQFGGNGVSSEVVHVPFILDGSHPGSLDALTIAAGPEKDGSVKESDLDGQTVMTSDPLKLQIRDGLVKWSLNGETWHDFSGSPAVYVIYREVGYNLTVKMTAIANETDKAQAFTVSITSPALADGVSYEIDKYSVDSVTPTVGSGTGTITLSLKDGDEVTIRALQSGSYSIVETLVDRFTLTHVEEGGNYIDDSQLIKNADDALIGVNVVMEKNRSAELVNEKKYRVKFVDEDNMTVLKDEVTYAFQTTADEVAKPEDDPTKPMNDEYTLLYRFEGWSEDGKTVTDVADVTKDVVYRAKYREIEVPKLRQRAVALDLVIRLAEPEETDAAERKRKYEAKLIDALAAAGVTLKDTGFFHESDTAYDYLNEMQPNGLRLWECLRTGTPVEQKLLDTALGEGANQLSLTMAAAPVGIKDLGYDVYHVLRKYKENGESVTWDDVSARVEGEYPNFEKPAFAIDLLDEEGKSKNASGFYRVVTQIVPKYNTEEIINEIPSPNIIAVLEVNSGLKKTMTAIPWVALPSDPDAAELPSITVNNYVQTGQLSASDAVYSIDANGIYEKWILGGGDGQQGALTWTSATTVANGSSGETVVQDAPDPATHGLSRGAATWVERVSEGKPYFLVGQYAPGNITVNIAGGSDTVPASTIIANPSINALPVNSIAWGDNPTTKDTIEVYNDKNICYNLQWNKKKKEWGRSAKVWDETFQAYRSQWQNDFTIPAGTGVRYKRCGGAFTVTVSADQVKETVQSGTGE